MKGKLITLEGIEGVGKSTTNSVVISYCCILLSNFFLTMGLNLIRSQIVKVLPEIGGPD